MKFNRLWLNQWLDTALTTEEICEKLTMLGLEVEEVSPVAKEFSGVVVGKVVECTQHPNADKLQVTKVDVGDEILEIVCGASNCRAGLKVACAKVGAKLPDFTIKKANLRGQASFGMLCSFAELGIEGYDHLSGIIELDENAPIGVGLREFLGLDDEIITIAITPNRADCLSILGVARELTPQHKSKFLPLASVIDDVLNVEVATPEACPKYFSRIIKNIDIKAKTPFWMQETLRRAGIRSVNAVVDVTNFVMLEIGQPMHAFDLEQISSSINVRFAKQGEKITILDGKNLILEDNHLVIADDTKVLAVAGICGSVGSAISENSTSIVLESAFFNPKFIRGVARSFGLNTESSYRFERGVDFHLPEVAIERATQLILQICGGKQGPVVVKENAEFIPQITELTLRIEKLEKLLGQKIPLLQVHQILTNLGFSAVIEEDLVKVTVPSFRFDIFEEVDLIEEIARVYNYNNFVAINPVAELTDANNHRNLNRITNALVDLGFYEVITYSFVEPALQELLGFDKALNLANPIASDMSQMRVSLLPGLLQTALYNQNRQQTNQKLFEVGLTFIAYQNSEFGVKQQQYLAGLVLGNEQKASWQNKAIKADFFSVKNTVSHLLEIAGITNQVEFIAKEFSYLHPGQSAVIMLNNEQIGLIGKLHPELVDKLDLKETPFYFELQTSILETQNTVLASAISKFPANKRDLALIIDENIKVVKVLQLCKLAGGENLTDCELFDLYQGENIGKGLKSIAISLTIQNTTRTLTENEINQVVTDVTQVLQTEFNAQMRD